MVMQVVVSEAGSYLVLDESGRAIGRVTESRFPLERVPPADTVFLDRGAPPRRESGHTTEA